MTHALMPYDRSLVISTDVPFGQLDSLVRKTCRVPGVGGYKIGFALGLERGLPEIVDTIRSHTDLPIIYDHQKAGNDIPAMGKQFARVCAQSGVDAVILLPFTGEDTERAWIKACQDEHLGLIVGAHMTHSSFLYTEGGSISDDSPERIYNIAMQERVRHFVVPGNKPSLVQRYVQLFQHVLGDERFDLYAPGFITQKGDIQSFSSAAGKYWHPIVGSAIYNSDSPEEIATSIASQIITTEVSA